MAVAYQDTSVPGAPTLIVGGTVGSQAPVSVATNDNVILSTNDDNIALIVTGGGTDALARISHTPFKSCAAACNWRVGSC
jgi:hypothetical protein